MKNGVGMPAMLKLHLFGAVLRDAFPGVTPYQVGSSLQGKTWRDVDVRMMFDEDEWRRLIGDELPDHTLEQTFTTTSGIPLGSRRFALELAFSELGRAMTGLPIDFQVQLQKIANERHGGLEPGGHPRNAIGLDLGNMTFSRDGGQSVPA